MEARRNGSESLAGLEGAERPPQRKSLSVMGAVVLLLGTCASSWAGENILGNGGFETTDAAGAAFAKWTTWKWEGECQVGVDTGIKHGGKSSFVMSGSGPCKIAVHQAVATQAGFYKLSGYVRGINLKEGQWGNGVVISMESKGKELLNNLPLGTYGWRKFERTYQLTEACPGNEIYVYLFGAGKAWLDDLSLEKVEGEGLKEGLVMAEAEKLAEYPGSDAMSCAYCGMKLDPKQAKCVVCGEPTTGAEAYAKVVKELAALEALPALVAQAKQKEMNTLYAEIPLVVGKRFLAEGWRKQTDKAKRADWTAFLVRQATYEKDMLEGALAGKADPRAVPPVPDYRKLVKKDNYFYLDDKPMLLVTQGNSGGERGDARYLAPGQIYGIVSAVGASRYDYDKTPIWKVYQDDPKSHRVYDGGWCGHIIRDKWSMGGANAGVCIISLDYPPMREAVRQAVAQKAQEFSRGLAARPERIISMDWEFTYQNYDDASKALWQKWLKDRHGTIETLNGIWKTRHPSFEEVTLPPIEWNAERNPAKFYDFGEFNLWRFSDYFVWARKVIEGVLPGYPFTTGGGSPFGTEFAKQGIDEELLRTMGAVDVFLSETGSRSWGTAVAMDLVRSLDPKAMIHDPEYHATGGFMPLMFFHGASTLDFYNVQKDGLAKSLPHGYATLRGCLEMRRLGQYIVQFPQASPQVALLYSRGSLIQKYPGRVERKDGADTPYTLELKKCYEAGIQLDTDMGFQSTRQVKAGIRQDLKVMILPCAYYTSQEEWKGVMGFVQGGGTVVLTPTSAVADEYNRRRDYLKELGVAIVRETVPKYLASKAEAGVNKPGSEYDFIQGPIADTVVADSPTAAIKWTAAGKNPTATLAGNGIRQEIKLTGAHEVLATFADGQPAIVRRKLGAGSAVYVAMQLDEASMAQLLDWVYDRAGVKRMARVTDPAGQRIAGLETRTVAGPEGTLTYLYNMTDRTVKAVVQPAANLPVRSLEDLTYARTVKPDAVLELGPYDWVVLKLKP